MMKFAPVKQLPITTTTTTTETTTAPIRAGERYSERTRQILSNLRMEYALSIVSISLALLGLILAIKSGLLRGS